MGVAVVVRILFLCLSFAALTDAVAGPLPRVASLNLCTDQLLLSIAEPAQIASLSWLSADPAESLQAGRASQYPLNYGTAEEILSLSPDVVLGSEYSSTFARALLQDLGLKVVVIDPATSVADIERNVITIAEAVDQPGRGQHIVAQMKDQLREIRTRRSAELGTAIVIRPGGFTISQGSLAENLIQLAGLSNLAAAGGLDEWGSLPLETLLVHQPEWLILTGYRSTQSSLANAFLDHPVLRRQTSGTTQTITVDGAYWSCGQPASLDSVGLLLDALGKR